MTRDGAPLNLGPLNTNGYVPEETFSYEAEVDNLSSLSNSPAPQDPDESEFYNGSNDSQSSIGATFQDMAVTEEVQKPTGASSLPAEVLICIFGKLSKPHDQLNCMLVCKRWARNCVDLLWHRPVCATWEKHERICRTLCLPTPYFVYPTFVRRLNLAAMASDVNDGSIQPLAVCKRIERLTLTSCKQITDGGLMDLLKENTHLLALDIAQAEYITEASMNMLADFCHRLQGLNITQCKQISNDSLINVAKSCRAIKRLKLNGCEQLDDSAIMAFATYCRNVLEIDLQSCGKITNDSVTALLQNGQCLRELRLAGCELLSDNAFITLPPPSQRTYEHLRILDLTSCVRLTDRAVAKIIDVAPRLRNIVFAKCRNLTDAAVFSISKLGKNLHYLHLGHCTNITDASVKHLVKACNRIRYIDLGCCLNLTDDSVHLLATLPKLRRIGLVKCANITDMSVHALATAGEAARTYTRRDAAGHRVNALPPWLAGKTSNLERVHLSYCTNLTLVSIVKLLNHCPKLTHLSLTGVVAFLRPDLEEFCREAPQEFTDHQRTVFCVFSGEGVKGLRDHLNRTDPYFPGYTGRLDADDDQTMTGMMGTTTLAADEEGEDAEDGDEELDAEDEMGGAET